MCTTVIHANKNAAMPDPRHGCAQRIRPWIRLDGTGGADAVRATHRSAWMECPKMIHQPIRLHASPDPKQPGPALGAGHGFRSTDEISTFRDLGEEYT